MKNNKDLFYLNYIPKNSNDILKFFINYGTDIEKVRINMDYYFNGILFSNKVNVLHFLCEWGDIETIKFLIDKHNCFIKTDNIKYELLNVNTHPIIQCFIEIKKNSIEILLFFLHKGLIDETLNYTLDFMLCIGDAIKIYNEYLDVKKLVRLMYENGVCIKENLFYNKTQKDDFIKVIIKESKEDELVKEFYQEFFRIDDKLEEILNLRGKRIWD